MDKVQAHTEAVRMTNALRVFKDAEEVLDVAFKAEANLAVIARELATAKQTLAAVQADLKLAQEQYSAKTAEFKSGMAALQATYVEQEKANQDKLKAYDAQLDEIERARDVAKKVANQHVQQAQTDAGKKREDLEKEYGTRKMQLEMEESAVRERLESAKAELAALLKRVGG